MHEAFGWIIDNVAANALCDWNRPGPAIQLIRGSCDANGSEGAHRSGRAEVTGSDFVVAAWNLRRDPVRTEPFRHDRES